MSLICSNEISKKLKHILLFFPSFSYTVPHKKKSYTASGWSAHGVYTASWKPSIGEGRGSRESDSDEGLKTLWKFVAENHTENFATLKITLKNNIKEGLTENYTEKRPLLFRNAKNGLLITFLSKLNTILNIKPFNNYIESIIITLKIWSDYNPIRLAIVMRKSYS